RPSPAFSDGSAADLRHRSACPYEAWLVYPVLELLVPDGEAEQALELVVGGSLPQRRLEIPFPPGEEARSELSVGGQPYPVAVRAERLRDRVDEADLAGAVGEPEPPRGRRRLRGDLLERP